MYIKEPLQELRRQGMQIYSAVATAYGTSQHLQNCNCLCGYISITKYIIQCQIPLCLKNVTKYNN